MKYRMNALIIFCAFLVLPSIEGMMSSKNKATVYPYLKYQTQADKDLASQAVQARLAISSQKGLVSVGDVKGPGAAAINDAYQKLSIATTERDLKKITAKYVTLRTQLEVSSTQQANKASAKNLQNIAQAIADLDKAYLLLASPGQATKAAVQKPVQAETGLVPKQPEQQKAKAGIVSRGMKVVGSAAANPAPLARRLLKKPEKPKTASKADLDKMQFEETDLSK